MFGFEISAIFDTDKKKIGKKIGPTTVEDIKNLADIKNRKIKLAIIAVPGDTAQQIMDSLIKVGVTGILNLSPCYLKAPDNVKVVTIDLAMELGILPYYT
jgi:redox-sensing transcriptional repressor